MKTFIQFLYFLLVGVAVMLPATMQSQDILGGQVRGNVQIDAQTYEPNDQIGITQEDINGEKVGMNAFGNFIYTNRNFTAGFRFESYLKPLVGFDREYEGLGIPYRFASYQKDRFEITVGNFYDQFGNGLIFRAYEEWTLGYDNSVDGIRVKFNPFAGVTLKGIYGVQRYYWEKYSESNRGIVRGVDAEISLNEMVGSWAEGKTKVIIGGAMVSKYQKDDPFFTYKLPENVSAFSGRFNISNGRVNFLGEYAYKINDPSEINNNIFKEGQALFLSASYSQKGFGVTLGTKWIDNMSFKSDRTITGNSLDLSFLPPLTKVHSYSLEAMYPYATQPNGEMALNGQIVYTLPKKSKLGGKYGTTLELNYTRINSIEKKPVDANTEISQAGTLGYESAFFKFGDELFFEDINIELTKKISQKWKIILAYTHLIYNFDVIEEGIETGDGHKFYTHVGVADITHKFNNKHALKLELQYLQTKQDSGNWVAGLLEYTIAPNWFFSVRDEYNFNNPETSNTYHYYSAAMGYTNGPNRIQFSYGLQREGILCVGGVCRRVPAASGFTIAIFSSF
ncbi:MAG: hypothetical protein JW731_14795 [Bacteroidales bacterium]|nr:hypothetical protein [Bacteroidales bacterium]